MGRGSLPVVAWWTSQPPSPGHACRWLCCQRYTRVPYWCSCKPQQWKKQINNDRNFSWRRPTGQSVKILESGSRHQCSSPYLGGNHLLPSPKVSGWWAQDLVLKERGRTGPVCCMALKYRAVKLDPLHAWPVTQTACMKWLKLISMLTNNERPCFFFSLGQRYDKTSHFYTCWRWKSAGVFETFTDFSMTGNAWKELLLLGIEVTFLVLQSISRFGIFHFFKAFLMTGRDKEQWKGLQPLNPGAFTRHHYVYSRYFFQAC